MLLVLGSHNDPHIQSVCEALSTKGIDSRIVSHNRELIDPIMLSGNEGLSDIQYASFSFSNLHGLWNRVKLSLPTNGSGEKFQRDYAVANCWHAYYHHLIGHAKACGLPVLNSPNATASSKITSLATAAACGFDIPETIVPASKNELLAFSQRAGDLIVKALKYSNLPPSQAEAPTATLMTYRVTSDDINKMQESDLRITPQLFQEEIRKTTELRVIGTREKIIVYEIHSQANIGGLAIW